MFKIFTGTHKSAAMTFLSQHLVGQKVYSNGDGGAKMRYLLKQGHITSDRIAENRWVHKIVSKP